MHQALIDITQRDERFRESLPLDLLSASEVSERVVNRCHELFQVLARDVQVDDAVRHLDDRFFDGLRMLPGAHFVAAHAVDEIGMDTTVERRAGVICRVLTDGAESIIEFPGGRVGKLQMCGPWRR